MVAASEVATIANATKDAEIAGTVATTKEETVVIPGAGIMADAPRRPAPEELGMHPGDKKPITLREGRFGPYVQHGTVRATLPKDKRDEKPSLELAIELVDAKASKKKTATKKKATAKKKTTTKKKTSAKKKAPEKKRAAKSTTLGPAGPQS